MSTTETRVRIAAPGAVLTGLTDALERAEALDDIAARAQRAVQPLLSSGPVKDVLSGTWLGHPVHPLLIVLPIGTWVSATLLDLVGGRAGRVAADRLVAAGVLSTLPTAATGLSDWLDTQDAERRVGLVHAVGNTVALGLQLASLRARRRGRRATGVTLSLAANALVAVTGYLGGHLSYNQGVGVDTTAFRTGPGEWTAVAEAADLLPGRPIAVPAGAATILLVRTEAGEVRALDDRCTHRGGPLHEGTVDGDCVQCPWHGSVFRLDDGSVQAGPASVPQPAYETRVVDGRVEVRRLEPRNQRHSPT